MPLFDEYTKHEILEITTFLLIGIISSGVLPFFIGFVWKGFEESFVAGQPLTFGTFLVSYLIYYGMLGIGTPWLGTLKIREMLLTKNGEPVASQSNPKLFAVAILHDPKKDGLLYNLLSSVKGERFLQWSLSQTRVFFYSLIIFSFIGILQLGGVFQSFTSIPQVALQSTPAMKVLFTAEPASFAETILMMAFFFSLLGILAFFTSKMKFSKTIKLIIYFTIAFFILCPFMGYAWQNIHNIVYPNSDTSRISVFIFGWVGASITLLFGSWMPWWVWHFCNNFFLKLKEVAPNNEDVLFFSILYLVILIIMVIMAEFTLHKYRKKKPKDFEKNYF